MAVVVLTSAAGSPGVTTTAVGLALTWPRSVLLADCDPGAYQAVLSGYLKGQNRTAKGMLRVAEAHRDRRPLREVVIDQTIPLTREATSMRAFLPGFSKPGSAALFAPVWADLMEAFSRLDEVELDVIIDAGRLGPHGLPQPMVEAADLICLCVRSSLRALAGTRMHSPTLVEQAKLAATDEGLGLILIGDGKPYRSKEIAGLLGIGVLATINDDPVAAASFSDGATRGRKFDSSAYVRSLNHTAASLTQRLQQIKARIGV